MTETMTYTGVLTIKKCWCGIVHAIPEDLDTYQRRQSEDGIRQESIYCPLGHQYIRASKTKAQREAADRLAWAKASDARASALQDQLLAERRQHAATKGKLTKMRKRIAAGVCPCCNRSFKQVRQHMERQHPDEAAIVFAKGA